MSFTADTSFFIRVSEGNEKARRLWDEILVGKGRIIIPTVVIVELKNNLTRKNMKEEAEELISIFESNSRITMAPLTLELAKRAGEIGYSYNLTNFDSVVVATAIHSGYDQIITSDPSFLRAQKDGKIKVIAV